MKRLLTLFGACCAGVVPMLAAAPAGAQTGPPAPVIEQIESKELEKAPAPASDSVEKDFLDSQARQGRLVDAGSVRSAKIRNHEFVWEAGAQPKSAKYALSYSTEVKDSKKGAFDQVVEMAFESEEQEVTKPGKPTPPTKGLGMLSASYSGGTRLTSGCQTWTVDSNKVTACYQKFKPTSDGSSTRDYYAYNRWATAEGKQISFGTDFQVVKIDIRSRPRAGYGSRIVGLTDYFPHDSSQLCNEGSSVNLGVGSLSLSVGLTNCGDKSPIVDANSKTMGLIYDDGFIFGGRVKGADFEMEVSAPQGGATPLFGDYNYAKFCRDTLLNCTGVLGKDGW